MSTSTATDVDALRAVGLTAGLDAVGVAPADVFAGTKADLERRLARGLDGGMQFTYRNPERSTDPGRVVLGARAIVVGARAYRRARPSRPPGSQGRVASYAREDHYADLRAGLTAMADVLVEAGHAARVVADDNALVDREAARRAGLGWYGKNTNILLPGRGSWFVLGSVVTDAALPPARDTVEDGCGPCSRCLDGCPTGAIIEPGVIDARRCLAWLVQSDGAFPVEHRASLGDRIYGCDDCQEVCPPNQRIDRESTPPAPGPAAEAWVDLCELLAADDETLLDRHGRWYVPRRDPRYLRRNALVALGNVGEGDDPRVSAAIDHYRQGDDPMLAEHARWAAARLVERGRS